MLTLDTGKKTRNPDHGLLFLSEGIANAVSGIHTDSYSACDTAHQEGRMRRTESGTESVLAKATRSRHISHAPERIEMSEKIEPWISELARKMSWQPVSYVVDEISRHHAAGCKAAQIVADAEKRAEESAECEHLAADKLLKVEAELARLREKVQVVIEWERDYRTRNNLGKRPPDCFVELAKDAARKPSDGEGPG